LLTASSLPFQAPPFDRIKDSDYLPAFNEGMRQHLEEVQRITGSTEPPTFDNTILALERSGETLGRVSRIFFGLVQADTNEARQAIQEEVAPKLAAHQDEINLDPKLFARVKTLYDQRETLQLDPVQKRLVEHYYDGLVRAGAQLDDADKASLRKLNVEETTLATQFHTRLVAATAAGAVVVSAALLAVLSTVSSFFLQPTSATLPSSATSRPLRIVWVRVIGCPPRWNR